MAGLDPAMHEPARMFQRQGVRPIPSWAESGPILCVLPFIQATLGVQCNRIVVQSWVTGHGGASDFVNRTGGSPAEEL